MKDFDKEQRDWVEAENKAKVEMASAEDVKIKRLRSAADIIKEAGPIGKVVLNGTMTKTAVKDGVEVSVKDFSIDVYSAESITRCIKTLLGEEADVVPLEDFYEARAKISELEADLDEEKAKNKGNNRPRAQS